MKVEYLNPFIAATRNVLSTMARLDSTPGKPYLKNGRSTFGDVTGVIGMASETVAGNLVISFRKSCILAVVAKMFMEEPRAEIDDEVMDAVGEITNIICGGAKAGLAKLGLAFDLATPTMIKGRDIMIRYPVDSPIVVIPFATDAGEFVIEANLAERR